MKKNTKNYTLKLEQIYRISLKVFGQYGYRKTNIEDITDALNMTIGSVYFYVKNKKDLYEKTIIYAVNMLRMHQISVLLKEENAAKALIDAALAGVDFISSNEDLSNFIQKNPDIFNLTKNDFYQANYKEYRKIMDVALEFAKNTLKKGIDQKVLRQFDVDYLPETLLRIHDVFIIHEILPRNKSKREKATQEIIDFVLNGILNHNKD